MGNFILIEVKEHGKKPVLVVPTKPVVKKKKKKKGKK